MSAPKNMAKRAAAGTLALAVCLSGGAVVLAGTANAAMPVAGDITTTPSTGSTTVAAPTIIQSTAQAVADTTITFGAGDTWATGDHVVLQLPAGVAFNGTPTVTASKVTGTGTAAPTFSVATLATSDDPSTSVAGPTADPVAAVRQLEIKFTNSKGTSTAEAGTAWKLVVSGIKVDVSSSFSGSSIVLGGSASTVSATTGTKGKVYGETYDSNAGTYGSTALLTSTTTSDVLAYVQKASISVPAGASFVNSGGVQSAPDVTVTEAMAESITTGSSTLTFGFVDANNNPVKLDDSSLTVGGDSFAPTLSVNGTAATTGTFTSNSTGNTLTTPSITFTTGADVVKLGNLRFQNQSSIVGPIKAVLTSPAATQVGTTTGYQPKSGTSVALNDPNSRLGGATRFDTAAQIANSAFPTTSHYSKYVLASGDGDGVDALSANYLAGNGFTSDAPLLLTSSTGLSDATLAYLAAAVPTSPTTLTFDIVGGASAVSPQVLTDIKAAFPSSDGWTVIFNRAAGADRYDTAAKAAISAGASSVKSFSGTYGQAAVKTAILASGLNSADAVAGGGISYKAGFPLLLTKMDSLPDATVNALQTLGIQQVVVLGGTGAVSADVATQLAALNIKVIRVAGADRYATATAIADWARTPTVSTNVMTNAGLGYNGATYVSATSTTHTSTTALLGNGTSYADVLAAGQLSGASTYVPVFTTGSASLSSPTSTWLTTNHNDITTIAALGGAAVVSNSTLQAAVDAAN